MECVWSVELECEVWSVKCGVLSVKCGEVNVECGVCNAKWYWGVPCASSVVQSSTGNYSVQDLQYKVVL